MKDILIDLLNLPTTPMVQIKGEGLGYTVSVELSGRIRVGA